MWQVAQVGTNMSRVVSVFGVGGEVEQVFAARRTGRRAWTRRRSRSASGPAPCGTGRRWSAGGRARPRWCGACGRRCRCRWCRRRWACRRRGTARSRWSWPQVALERVTSGCGGRRVPPGWNCSEKATCSGVRAFLAVDRSPRRRGVAAAQELLVDGFVAAAAVAGGQVRG